MNQLLLFLLVSVVALPVFSQTLQPYKDHLFNLSNHKVYSKTKGDFLVYDFIKHRDLYGQDRVIGQVCKKERVDLSPIKRTVKIDHPSGQLDTYEVGDPNNATFAVIYIHDEGLTKEYGANDYSFGGNFNRLKNLAVRNQGVYYSPTVAFDQNGTNGIVALIDRIKSNSPKAKVVLACTGSSAFKCWAIGESHSHLLSGLIFLSSTVTHPGITKSRAVGDKLPMIIVHGTNDSETKWKIHKAQYQELKSLYPNYPMQLQVFVGGSDRVPLRLIDWRQSLNWIFNQSN